jgi:hypothetical protein
MLGGVGAGGQGPQSAVEPVGMYVCMGISRLYNIIWQGGSCMMNSKGFSRKLSVCNLRSYRNI